MTATPSRLSALSAWYTDLAALSALTSLPAVVGSDELTAAQAADLATTLGVVLSDVTEASGVAPAAFGLRPRDVVLEARVYARDGGGKSARLRTMEAAEIIDARMTGPVPSGVAAALLSDSLRVNGRGRLVLATSVPRGSAPDDTTRGQLVRVRYTLTPTA